MRPVYTNSVFQPSWSDSRKMCLRGMCDTCTVAHMLDLRIICDAAAERAAEYDLTHENF
jgi:hypothetical protein